MAMKIPTIAPAGRTFFTAWERGMIYIRKGQQVLKDKKYAQAADCYSAAIAAYDTALKKQPQKKNFQVNCRQGTRLCFPAQRPGWFPCQPG